MSISILGPLMVDDAASVPPRDRVLLSALVVRRGEVVRQDQLAEAIWRGDPPGSWRKVVQSTVVRLRKLLGAATIETTPSGYRLITGDDDVDAWRFEHLVHRAAELAELSEHDRAADVLDRALALWRGEPFADLDGWAPGEAEASRLVELRLRAEERLVETRLALAEHGDVAGTARALVAAEPLREQRWALLSLALYRAGRQGEALRSLHEARMTLADQLGVEPGTELVDLETAILAHDTTLRAPPGPALRTIASKRCPYKGLEAYNEDDRDLFFGREAELAACRRRLAATGVLVVVGASGSGKSSLVLAGLTPALREGGRRVTVCTPGANPSVALGAALSAVGGDGAVVVDQGEELFTVCTDPIQRSDFCAALVDRAASHAVVLTLRADHVGSAASLPELARLVEAGMLLLGPMGEAELRTAIEGPARQAGLRLEAGLVDLLVRDVINQPGAMPLLSHALAEIWSRREGRVLTVSAYRDSGGVHGAVARTAEALYASLPERQRPVARSLFLRLVSVAGDGEAVRHRLSRNMLAANQDDVVNTLVRARLLTASEDALEIAHEALARAWPRLQRWLEEDSDGQRIHAHLCTTAEDWEERGRDRAELYRGARLEAATEWVARNRSVLSATESSFLAASTAQQEREAADVEQRLRRQRRVNRRLRGLLIGGAVALVIALVAATVATNQWNEATDQRDRASAARRTADAGRLAAQSRLEVDDNLSRALLLAVEANRLEDGPSTRGSLQAALLHDPFLLGFLPAAGPGLAYVAVDGDGSRLALAGSDGTVQLWDFPRRQPIGRPLRAGKEGSSLAFDPAEKQLFTANYDGTVSAFDVATGARRFRLTVPGRPWGIAVSPDNALVAVSSTVGTRGRVTLLSARRATVLATFQHERPVNGLAFSPDGRLLVAGTGDTASLADPAAGVIVWDVAARKETSFLRGQTNGVSAVAFSPDGRRFASTSTDQSTIVWDTATLAAVGPPLRDDRISGNHLLAVAFSPDGRRLVTGGAKVSIWDLKRRRVVGKPLDARGGGIVLSLGFGSAGNSLVAATAGGTAAVWDIGGRPALGSIVPGVGTDGGVLSGDGRFVAAVGKGPVPAVGIPETITLVDAKTRRPLGKALGEAGAIAFSPDGKRLALASGDGTVRIIDTSTRRLLARGPRQKVLVSGLAFSPDGRLLAAGRFDGSTALLDGSTGAPRGSPLRGHSGLVPFIAFRPDGHVMVTTSIGGGSIAWDLTRSPPAPRRLTDELSLRSIGVAFSPDGRLLATGATDGKVTFWDAHTFRPAGPPIVGAGVVQPASFSSDSRLLATSADDRTVRLYDVISRQQIGIPFPKTSQYGSASLSPDGHTLITSGEAGAVFWDVDPRSWARRACATAGRNLTAAEWKRFLPDAGGYRKTCAQWPGD